MSDRTPLELRTGKEEVLPCPACGAVELLWRDVLRDGPSMRVQLSCCVCDAVVSVFFRGERHAPYVDVQVLGYGYVGDLEASCPDDVRDYSGHTPTNHESPEEG